MCFILLCMFIVLGHCFGFSVSMTNVVGITSSLVPVVPDCDFVMNANLFIAASRSADALHWLICSNRFIML
jgi:hypothetical protein